MCRWWVWMMCSRYKCVCVCVCVCVGRADREGEGRLQRLGRLHRSGRRLFAREALRRERRWQQVRRSGGQNECTFFLQWRLLFAFFCFFVFCNRFPVWINRDVFHSLRAIIIRAGEVIPMSTEFTPESERQRLQFLVRRNLFFQPSDIWGAGLPPPLSLSPPALIAGSIACAIVSPLPRVCQSSSCFFPYLKAYMQPHLLGNEFTHLEFPRRVQRKEVGKRMLYRDFTMSGWCVSFFWLHLF